MDNFFRLGLVLTFLGVCGARASGAGERRRMDSDMASHLIDVTDFNRHLKILASDQFDGRMPGTKGEDLTVNYVIKEFKKIGLAPGNPNGQFTQEVPLEGAKSEYVASATAIANDVTTSFIPNKNMVATSHRLVSEVNIQNSQMVFVGYGVIAPEYNWDDYKSIDMTGKTLVMLVGDPPIPDPADPTRLDDKMFKGKAMTYYGRWTYKYEIGAKLGAAAVIIIHETGSAGYPFEVLVSSNGRENFDIISSDRNMSRAAVEAWITNDKAQELLKVSNLDLAALKAQAIQKDFKPITLKSNFNVQLKRLDRHKINSRNIVAKLKGSDPKLRSRVLIYSAHWDHLGSDSQLTGDKIYNGALDNASGVSALLGIAKAFKKFKPKSTILFLVPTAEEKGLLGAKYYAENPLYPLAQTLADINIDSVNPWGRTRDIEIKGEGHSNLEDRVIALAHAQNRTVVPENSPEKGSYYRSDHFEFAKVGVPALMMGSGVDVIGKPSGYGRKKLDDYVANHYHKVSDEIKSDWDFSGGIEDLQLLFQLGADVADEPAIPTWKPGTEFEEKRQATFAK
jgi:Zn-dependent M28 family amino/carboxypeptidase